eukprot:2629987-Lingulodinium_polyedra.AAC.1
MQRDSLKQLRGWVKMKGAKLPESFAAVFGIEAMFGLRRPPRSRALTQPSDSTRAASSGGRSHPQRARGAGSSGCQRRSQ